MMLKQQNRTSSNLLLSKLAMTHLVIGGGSKIIRSDNHLKVSTTMLVALGQFVVTAVL